MIRKLIISAAILTALIVSKESHAAGVAGLARDLASSPALALQVTDWDLSREPETGALKTPDVDRMTTGNVADDIVDPFAAAGGLAVAGDIRMPSDITLFHPF